MLLLVFIFLSVGAFSQVTLNEKSAPFPKVIASIEHQTGYLFIYDEAKVQLGTINIKLKNATLIETLYQCFKDLPITYTIIEKSIVLKPKNEAIAFIDSAFIKFQMGLSITGTVTDEKGNAIPGAIAFLTNSEKITATDANGSFSLNKLQPGTYELVIKILGFDTYAQNITIQNLPVNITIKLNESNTALSEVLVKRKADHNRKRYLKFFIKNFLGESANANDCKILNTKDIKLHYDEERDVLEAWSDDFIVIRNKALGYQIKYLLKNFEFDAKNHIYTHQGYPYFEEMEGSDNQKSKWELNRRIAYEGSIRHFFKSLFNNTVESDGFMVYRFKTNAYNNDLTRLPLKINSLSSVIDKDFKRLKLKSAGEIGSDTSKLYIVYTKEDEPVLFYKSDGHITLPVKLAKTQNQISQIIPLTDNILLDKNGTFSPANKILFTGYWSWERVAELMPSDYSVDLLTTPATNTE